MDLMVGGDVRRKADGHEIFELGDAVFVGEARDENIRGGPVELFATAAVVGGICSGSSITAIIVLA